MPSARYRLWTTDTSSVASPGIRKWLLAAVAVTAVAVIAIFAWLTLQPSGPGVGFVSGNGRIEATEIDVATKLAGRVQYRIAQPGEVLASGGKVFNLVDLSNEARGRERRLIVSAGGLKYGGLWRHEAARRPPAVRRPRWSYLLTSHRRRSTCCLPGPM